LGSPPRRACGFENRGRLSRLVRQFNATETSMSGNRNVLFLIIGALIVGIGVLGYNLYQTKKEPSGLQINVGPDGLKVQNK
jgi:hypothetical protein